MSNFSLLRNYPNPIRDYFYKPPKDYQSLLFFIVCCSYFLLVTNQLLKPFVLRTIIYAADFNPIFLLLTSTRFNFGHSFNLCQAHLTTACPYGGKVEKHLALYRYPAMASVIEKEYVDFNRFDRTRCTLLRKETMTSEAYHAQLDVQLLAVPTPRRYL